MSIVAFLFFLIFDHFSVVFSVKRQHKGKTQNKKVLLTPPHLSLAMTVQWCMKVVLIKVKFHKPCAPMCSNHKLLRALLASLWSFGGCANSSNEIFILRAFSPVVRTIIIQYDHTFTFIGPNVGPSLKLV
jgi:hypothetical protein